MAANYSINLVDFTDNLAGIDGDSIYEFPVE